MKVRRDPLIDELNPLQLGSLHRFLNLWGLSHRASRLSFHIAEIYDAVVRAAENTCP